MALTKVTLFCRQPREFSTGQGRANSTYKDYGWTENFHLAEDVVGNAAAEDKVVELGKLRAKLLPITGYVQAVRMQKVDPVGRSKLIKAYAAGKVRGEGDDARTPQDDPENCLIINCLTAEAANRRLITLRGIPDSIMVGGYYNNLPGFHRDLKAFCDYLQSNGFGFRGKDFSGETKPILAISALGAVILKEDTTLDVPNEVQILRTIAVGHRAKGYVTAIALRTDARNLVLANWFHGACKGGRIRLVKPPKFFPLSIDARSIANPDVGNRDTGSPSGRPRGRRSAKYV